MEITAKQLSRIEPYLPRQRGNVRIDNLQVLNAILYVAERDSKWRSLPKRFGPWHTIYTRMNRWSKAGVLDRVFEQMQHQQLVRIKLEAVGRDSAVKVPPQGTGAQKKAHPRRSARAPADGAPRCIWLPRMFAAPHVLHSRAAARSPQSISFSSPAGTSL